MKIHQNLADLAKLHVEKTPQGIKVTLTPPPKSFKVPTKEGGGHVATYDKVFNTYTAG